MTTPKNQARSHNRQIFPDIITIIGSIILLRLNFLLMSYYYQGSCCYEYLIVSRYFVIKVRMAIYWRKAITLPQMPIMGTIHAPTPSMGWGTIHANARHGRNCGLVWQTAQVRPPLLPLPPAPPRHLPPPLPAAASSTPPRPAPAAPGLAHTQHSASSW